jgi:anthranilate phosphoribosyltransferase
MSDQNNLPLLHAGSGMVIEPSEFAHSDRTDDFTAFLKLLLQGHTLDRNQMSEAFECMIQGRTYPAETGAFLALLATRCPTSDEILGAARVMRKHVDRVPCARNSEKIVDTAGTGGAPKTFNVSTAAAIIAAAAGSLSIAVAKHGNRSRTGRGSAEVLEALGVNVHANRANQARCLDEIGLCFCFAIHHHPATRYVMPVRQALGFATIFNLLGPLTNPAGAQRQLVGVCDSRFLQPVAEALRDLGVIRAMVVNSNDGLDELSISASTNAIEVHKGKITEMLVSPRQLGLTLAPMEAVTARDLTHAVEMIKGVLAGSVDGAPRDMALLNAAATLLVGDVVESQLGTYLFPRQGQAAGAYGADPPGPAVPRLLFQQRCGGQ